METATIVTTVYGNGVKDTLDRATEMVDACNKWLITRPEVVSTDEVSISMNNK